MLLKEHSIPYTNYFRLQLMVRWYELVRGVMTWCVHQDGTFRIMFSQCEDVFLHEPAVFLVVLVVSAAESTVHVS